MFSRLDKIFRTQNDLRTERIETPYGVIHHDDPMNKKHPKKQKKEEDKPVEDDTALSVMGLRAFVHNLLGEDSPNYKSDDIHLKPAPEKPEHSEDNPKSDNSNSPASRAAAAYGRTYNATHPENVPDPELPASATPPIDALLTPEDKDLLKQLLQDLRTLSAAHVEYIHIPSSSNASFFENLLTAVKSILQQKGE